MEEFVDKENYNGTRSIKKLMRLHFNQKQHLINYQKPSPCVYIPKSSNKNTT